MRQIPLPNYGAQAEAVVQGFDNLLQFHREKKQREAENRQFLRQKELMNLRNEFRMQLQEDQQDFQVSMVGMENELARSNTLFEHGLQQNMYDKQRGDAVEDREDTQAHQKELAQMQAMSQNQKNALNHQREVSNDFQKRLDDRTEQLESRYGEVLRHAGITYQIAPTENGIGVAVQGGEFGEEGVMMPYTTFTQRMQPYRNAYDKYNYWNQYAEENDVRRATDPENPEGVFDDFSGEDSGEYRQITREGMNKLYDRAFTTGDFSDVRRIGTDILLDETPRLELKPLDFQSAHNSVFALGDPETGDYTIDFEDESHTVNFRQMSFGEAKKAYDEIVDQAKLYEKAGKEQRYTDEYQPKYKSQFNSLKQAFTDYKKLMDKFSMEADVKGPELFEYSLSSSGFDATDPTSFFSKNGSGQNTQYNQKKNAEGLVF